MQCARVAVCARTPLLTTIGMATVESPIDLVMASHDCLQWRDDEAESFAWLKWFCAQLLKWFCAQLLLCQIIKQFTTLYRCPFQIIWNTRAFPKSVKSELFLQWNFCLKNPYIIWSSLVPNNLCCLGLGDSQIWSHSSKKEGSVLVVHPWLKSKVSDLI